MCSDNTHENNEFPRKKLPFCKCKILEMFKARRSFAHTEIYCVVVLRCFASTFSLIDNAIYKYYTCIQKFAE